ncbi:MAG: hypothetical protein Q3989_11245 [Eubacteriales bacterium]|nr:hypothetical protein [Eubacteriales bacterium]
MTKSDAKKYELLKKAVFGQAQLYANLYRKQCELYNNPALEEEFSQKHAEMMEIIKKAELEVEYRKYKKELSNH